MVTVNESVTKGLKDLGNVATDATEEAIGQLRETASACCERGRDEVRQVESIFARFFREQPVTSVLVAAGVGLLFGRIWKR